MRRLFGKLLAMAAVMLLICGCFGGEKVVTADMSGGEIRERPQPVDPIEEQLNSMTLEEKVGQMMIVGFNGTELNDDIIYSLNQFHFGGIILFDRNLESVAQAKALTTALQAKQKIPLFIALDEEGGRVARGKNFLPPF